VVTRFGLIAATAALLLAAPVAAMGQAVPPRSQTEAKLPSETLGNHASNVGTAAGVVETGAEFTDAVLDLKKGLDGASRLAPTEELTRAIRTTKKVAGTAKVVGAFAGVVATAADSATAYEKCTNPQNSKAECAVASLDVVADVAGLIPGPAATLSTTYAVSKAGGEYLNSLAPNASANFYDWWYSDEQAEAFAKASTPEALESLRQKRRAAYTQAQGGLMSKQADYDAQQARLEAERQAAAQQAAQQATSAYQSQTFLNNLNAALQPQLQPLTQGGGSQTTPCAFWAPCNGGVHTQAQYDALVAKAKAGQATSARPPSSSGSSCGLTPADIQAGRVCTAN